MNWWLGLGAGVVIGGLIWGWSGAFVFGFVGWLVVVIAGSKKSSAPVAKTPVAAATPGDPQGRIARLERSVASLEARLSRLELGGTPLSFGRGAGGEGPVVEPEPPLLVEAQSIVEAPPTVESPPIVETAPPVEQPVIPFEPPTPKEPPKPNFIVAWFTGGNTIVRVGAVILFVGLIFLLNYAREHQLIPPELRVAGVAIVGIILLVLGWKLRNKRTGYAVSLQGAGVAVLYLTIFSAMRLYHLVSPEAAFFLLAAVAICSAFIAIGQDSLALAIIG